MTENKTVFKVGDVVHLGVCKDIENKKQYPSPAMVVIEIVKTVEKSYNTETSELKAQEKVNCIWYNYKTGLYEERWFFAHVLTRKNFTGKTLDWETLKKNTKNISIRSSNPLFFDDAGEAKNSIFLSPPMSLLDIGKEANKPLNKHDQKTGDQIRWTTAYKERAKCIWFNPITGKYSEGFFILEALKIVSTNS